VVVTVNQTKDMCVKLGLRILNFLIVDLFLKHTLKSLLENIHLIKPLVLHFGIF